jgi:exonuclease VII small subunit
MNKTKQGIAGRIKELDQLVEWFYSPDFNLEAAVDRYKAARALAQTIEKDLLELKNEITLLADETKM